MSACWDRAALTAWKGFRVGIRRPAHPSGFWRIQSFCSPDLYVLVCTMISLASILCIDCSKLISVPILDAWAPGHDPFLPFFFFWPLSLSDQNGFYICEFLPIVHIMSFSISVALESLYLWNLALFLFFTEPYKCLSWILSTAFLSYHSGQTTPCLGWELGVAERGCFPGGSYCFHSSALSGISITQNFVK